MILEEESNQVDWKFTASGAIKNIWFTQNLGYSQMEVSLKKFSRQHLEWLIWLDEELNTVGIADLQFISQNWYN